MLLLLASIAAAEKSTSIGENPLTDNGSCFKEFVEKLSHVYVRQEISFFSDCGVTLNRNKKVGGLHCDRDHPEYTNHCPPFATSPFVGGGGPPRLEGADTSPF